MMMGAILLFAQATGTPAMAGATAPDIEISARVEAREVSIEQEGPIEVKLHAEPGFTDAQVERNQPAGTRSYRNLVVDARIAAWLARDRSQADTNSISSTGEPQ